MAFELKRGDACVVPVKIRVNGAELDIDSVERVEFMTGPVRKLYPEEASYDGDRGCFLLPLSQEDTFSLPAEEGVRFDVRVKFAGGCVLGTRRVTVAVAADAVSGEVI